MRASRDVVVPSASEGFQKESEFTDPPTELREQRGQRTIHAKQIGLDRPGDVSNCQ